MRLLLALVALAAACARPALASAKVLEYQLQYLPVGADGVSQVIVDVVLDPETKLPATVRVPLPTGAKLLWTGEILGKAASADPAREASVTAVSGGQLVTFTLSQSWVGQVEADYAAPSTSGDEVVSRLVWVNTADAAPLLPSVRLPAGAASVRITPKPSGETSTNASGETLYPLSQVRLATGQTYTVDVRYRRTASSAGATKPADVLIIVSAVLIVALLLVLTALALRARRRRVASQRR